MNDRWREEIQEKKTSQDINLRTFLMLCCSNMEAYASPIPGTTVTGLWDILTRWNISDFLYPDMMK